MADDLIRRKDAIRAIEELPNCYNGFSDTYDKAYIIGTLEEVPRAEPKECDTCTHKDEPWHSDACDGCCEAHSGYEPIPTE